MKESILLAACVATLIAGAADAATASYRIADKLAIGGDGKWDFPSVDSAAERLYLSRATHVVVVDTRTGQITGDIADTPGVHGIALAPMLGRGYISVGKSDQVKIFDLKTLAVTGSVPTGLKPDAIVYEPVTKQVFAFNGHSSNVTVIDAVNNKVASTIALPGAPEAAYADGAGKVFVNLENKNELAALDAGGRRVIGHWALPGCEGPTGLALDSAHRRSFSACANKKMSILDMDTGRSIATMPIGGGVDGAEFDPDSGNAFSPNGDGTLTVVHEQDPEHFEVVQTLATARGARTIALDPARHRLYLPTARFEESASSNTDEPKGPIVPGSFFVLVVDGGAPK
jgi:YVTN family beta-propeller protein